MIAEEEYKEYEDWFEDIQDTPLRDSLMLNALLYCGVDNWEGYEIAQEAFIESTLDYYIENVKGTNNNVDKCEDY